jgi:hypothetical protein
VCKAIIVAITTHAKPKATVASFDSTNSANPATTGINEIKEKNISRRRRRIVLNATSNSPELVTGLNLRGIIMGIRNKVYQTRVLIN